MMKRLMYLLIAGIFLAVVLIGAGCGEVNGNPEDSNDADKPQSVSEQRNTEPEEDEGNIGDEEIIEETNKTVLAELAGLETEWAQELHQLVVKSDELTDQWLYGDLVYNTYIMELYEVKQDFDRLYEECIRTYDEKEFAEKLKDEPMYVKGLAHGYQMRETIREFFDTTYGFGKDSTGGEKMDVSGDEYEQFYIDKMVTEYNDHFRKLNSALAEFK